MAKPPAFQFYPSDFLSDENVVLMNNQEVGCYIKLLCFCWKQGSIPNDISKIARLCNEDKSTMAQLWQSLKPCFIENGNDGRFSNPRLEKERQKQLDFRQERSSSGKKGAVSRWSEKKKDKNSSAIAQPLVEPMAKDGSSSSSSPSIKIYSAIFEKFWTAYPRKKNKGDAFKAWQKIKPNKNLLPKIFTAIEAQKKTRDWKKDNGDFIPYPATWLRASGWDDEIKEEKSNGTYYPDAADVLRKKGMM